jgi:isocitrate dehydrogenase
MLDHLKWTEAADLVRSALQETVKAGIVTYDLARQIPGATEVKCSVFGEEIVAHMG